MHTHSAIQPWVWIVGLAVLVVAVVLIVGLTNPDLRQDTDASDHWLMRLLRILWWWF